MLTFLGKASCRRRSAKQFEIVVSDQRVDEQQNNIQYMSRTLFSKTDDKRNKRILVADASAATTRRKTIEKDVLSGSFIKVSDGLHCRVICRMVYISGW